MLQLLRQNSIVCFCLLLMACTSSVITSEESQAANNSQSLTLTPVDEFAQTKTPFALPLDPVRSLQERVEDQVISLYTKQEGVDPFPLLSYPELSVLSQSEFSGIYGKQIGYRYTDDFSPQLDVSGRYLMVPGVKWQGEYVAANSSDDSTWLVDLSTGSIQELSPRSAFAVWSPNGEQAAYLKNETLYLKDMSIASESVPVFTEPGLGDFFLAWSPNGQQIAVISTAVGESIAGAYPLITDTLLLIPTTGATPQQLGTFSTVPIEHGRHELQWSPDGSALLVGMSQPNRVLTLNGQQLVLEEGKQALTWAPEQFQLLVRERDGSLSIMDVQNQETVVEITDGERPVTAWSFSHNGRYLAYSHERSGEYPIEILLFDLAQRETKVLGSVAVQIVSSLYWTPANDILILDDGNPQTPIWAMGVKPENTLEVLVEQGLLINVIQYPTVLSD